MVVWCKSLLISTIFIVLHAKAGSVPQYSSQAQDMKEYVLELKQYFNKIRSHYPDLSPSQEEWIESEQEAYERTKNIGRYERARQSDEFRIAEVIYPIDKLIGSLDGVIDADASENEKISKWVSVSSKLLNVQLWQAIFNDLDQNRSLKDDLCGNQSLVCGEFTVFYINNGVYPANTILVNIIEPSLARLQ